MLTFRNSKIVYYGPHPCEGCGAMIVKMGVEWGGTAFNAPDTYAYPNTEWHPHVCDPVDVGKLRADAEKRGLEASHTKPDAPVGINHASLAKDGTITVSYTGAMLSQPYIKTNAISGPPSPQRGLL
jgi:hypothetical protein